MGIKELETIMRNSEDTYTQEILPNSYMIVRLDGQGFSKLTKIAFKKPFDAEFSQVMIRATQECMNSGFRIIYAATHSDEISLLIHKDDNSFNRKERKIVSLLASAAAARFSIETGMIAKFDARVISFITPQMAANNFVWRQIDGSRNALNDLAYWTLRKRGLGPGEATSRLKGIEVAEKKSILIENGVNFEELPSWIFYGIGLYKEKVEVNSTNPITGKNETAIRNKLKVNVELPNGKAYRNFILKLIEESES